MKQAARRWKDPAQRRYYGSAAWKKLRALVLARDQVCTICGENPSTQADHLNGWQDNRLEAIRGVCEPCHRSKSAHDHRRLQDEPRREPEQPPDPWMV